MRLRSAMVVLVMLVGTPPGLRAQASSPGLVELGIADMPWKPIGPGLEFAVLEGNPGEAEATYSAALRLAPGAWIRPHWHPNAKRIVVLQGILRIGLGETFDTAGGTRGYPVGSFLVVPGGMVHFEGGEGTTVLLFTGAGPLKTTYVGPAAAPGR